MLMPTSSNSKDYRYRWTASAGRRALWGIGEAKYLIDHKSGSARHHKAIAAHADQKPRAEHRQKPRDWSERKDRRRAMQAASQKRNRVH